VNLRVLLIVVPLLALAACDRSSEGADGTAADPLVGSTDAPTSTPDGSAAPATQSVPPTTSSDGAAVVGSDPDSDWCVAARAVQTAGDAFDAVDFTDPAAIEAAIDAMMSEYEAALSLAPPEIASALNESFDGLRELRTQLEAVSYDFLEADLSVLDDADGSIDAANAEIGRYNEAVCGIVAGPAGGDTAPGEGFDPSAGTIREQAIAELVGTGFTEQEAGCIFDQLDFTDPELANDLAAMAAVFDTCGIDLARIAELGG
jgi:hypothetical protein